MFIKDLVLLNYSDLKNNVSKLFMCKPPPVNKEKDL